MLDERIFMLETPDGLRPASLPEALAGLCAGRVLGFEGLAAHQRHAWFLFLCQTAAMALVRSGDTAEAEAATGWAALDDAAAWRQRLADLTPGCADAAWSLVVDDLRAPAFLQPPIGTGLDRYGVFGRVPDEIDLLVNAKAHDVKPARGQSAEPRHWAFALVSLQTQQGYSGRGNFGIARMNGGFASRPMLMLTPERELATRFRRGVQVALTARAEALDQDTGLFSEDGLPLLWTQPWDTEQGLSLAVLDPLFVEVCRRVRLRRAPDGAPDGAVEAIGRPSDGPRVAGAKELKGSLGDAWMPVSTEDGAALTVAAGGFNYRRLSSVIASADFSVPAALRCRPGDPQNMWLHAAVLARGQGKTEGFHERWLRVPADLRSEEFSPAIGKIGEAMIGNADGARTALRIGLLTFLQAGPEKVDFKDERPAPVLETFEQQIDAIFFDHLFARFRAMAGPDAGAEDQARTEAAWFRALSGHARTLFERALDHASMPENRRDRARVRAGASFGGLMRKAGLTRPASTPAKEAAA